MRTRRWSCTFVRSDSPDRSYGGDAKISLQSSTGPVVAGGAGTRYGYVRGPLLAPIGATATEAKLNLVVRTTVPVSTTVYAERLSSGFHNTRVTWRDRPTADESKVASVVVPAGTTPGMVITLDVLPLVRNAILGKVSWHGLRLRASSAIQLHSEEPLDRELRPEFVVEWSEVPDAPSGMLPSGALLVGEPTPTLTWDFIDYGGDRSIGMVQAQISTNSAFTAIVFDSGEIDATAPSVETTGFVATPGVTYFWRARHADGSGLWNKGWSPTAAFRYLALPDITVTGLEGGVFTDATPLLVADAPDARRWRVRIVLRGRVVWTYDDTGSQLRVEVPRKVITRDDADYTFIFQAWDNAPRVATAGRPIYRTKSVVARFDDDAPLTKVTDLTATALSPAPGVELRWSRSAPADAWTIYRDGKVIDRLDTEDVVSGAGDYSYLDLEAPAGAHVYVVRPVEDKRTGSSGPGAPVLSKVEGRWIITDDGRMVVLTNAPNSLGNGLQLIERSEEIALANGRIGVEYTGWRGYAGEIEGQILNEHDEFGPQVLEEAEGIMREVRLAGRCRFAQGDINIPVKVRNVNLTRDLDGEGDSTTVVMRVIQDGQEQSMGLLGGWV